MNTNPHDDCDPVLRERLDALRHASAAIAPPPHLEAALRARLFPAAEAAAPVEASREPAAPVPGPATAASPARPASPVRPASQARPASPMRPSWFDRWANWIAWPVSVTAAAAWVTWMVSMDPPVAPPSGTGSSLAQIAEPAGPATPFLALAAADRITPQTRGEIIRASLPRATMAEFGLPVSPLRAAEPIEADFLVGADGGVLAVRFVDLGRP